MSVQKVLPFIKSNLVSFVSIAVAVIAAPVMVVFSRAWASRIYDSVSAEVAQHTQNLEGIDVTFRIDPYLSGQSPISVKAPPNEATVHAFASLLQRVVEGSEEVLRRAVEFNSRDKLPLIRGDTPRDRLFPDNDDESTRLRLLDEFVERWPKAHEELLREFHAGLPRDPASVRADLEEIRTKELARLSPTGNEASLTDEQRAHLTERLGRARLDLYRGQASNLCLYASPAVFTAVVPWDRTKVLPMETAWEWQHLYWIHRDIIRALSLANSDVIGAWRPVHISPVKLVESIAVFKPGERASRSGFPDQRQAPAAPALPAPPDASVEVQRDYSLSHTGRVASPVAANPLYDIRFVEVAMIASASRLPQVLAAFPRANFMTVVGLELSEVDPVAYLASGYDFGSEHVVRAVVRLETIWLRSWMRKWMPRSVRQALGIPDETAPAGATAPPE